MLKLLKLANKKQLGLNRCFILRNDIGCAYNLTCCQKALGDRFMEKASAVVAKYSPSGLCKGVADPSTLEGVIDTNVLPASPLMRCNPDPTCP